MLRDWLRRPAATPNATPNPTPTPPPLVVPSYRPKLVTPTGAVATHTRLTAHQTRRCAWCGTPGTGHGTRYAANRGPHPFEPYGYRPMRGVRL